MPIERHLPRYLLELGAALVAYTLLLVGSLRVLRDETLASPWREGVSLLPMVAGIAVAWVVQRAFRRMDELQVRIQLESLGFAFVGTALLTFGYGFLENVDYPLRTMFWVWPVMCTLWVVGQVLAHLRYR